MSLKDRLKTKQKLPAKVLDNLHCGERLEVRGFSAGRRSSFLQFIEEHKSPAGEVDVEPDAFYLAVAHGQVFDPESGELLFGEGDDAFALEFSGQDQEAITRAILELSGLDPKAERRISQE